MIRCLLRYCVVLAVLGAAVVGGGAGYWLGFDHGYALQSKHVENWNEAVSVSRQIGIAEGRRLALSPSTDEPTAPVHFAPIYSAD